MNYKVIALLVVCMAVIAVAGCTSSSTGHSLQSSSVEKTYDSDSNSGRTVFIGEEGLSQYWAASTASAPVAAPMPTSGSYGSGSMGIETRIIRTADMTLEVKDVTSAVESLKALAAAHGGYLSSTNIRENYNKQLSGTVIIRVPQASFDAAIAGTKALGTVKSISTSGQDVTEEYVDLQAQKTSYTNQLAQYNAIMKQSTKVEDIINVQEQIDRVQTQLDRLNGRLKYLDSRIEISTITVYLQEPQPVGGQAGHDFVSTINEGIAGFLGMIDALIILAFTLLPLVIVGGIAYWAYRWHKGKKGAAPAPATREEKK
ncbi:MAG: DUF4349 domain-containing protein [Methanoregula sp.]|jgi:hypothetical protein|uniref:DUF4349 domain-containing protein n=1 Tax=Methanoregula sp. TaxID=2052170 RepID=UPI0025EEB294|nr:DUF4349 domain-containing protein [Methanoregula sp.]MCK9630175.1 DUF4349 domain-containing protein [Methanoregula sp.]